MTLISLDERAYPIAIALSACNPLRALLTLNDRRRFGMYIQVRVAFDMKYPFDSLLVLMIVRMPVLTSKLSTVPTVLSCHFWTEDGVEIRAPTPDLAKTAIRQLLPSLVPPPVRYPEENREKSKRQAGSMVYQLS